MDVLKRIKYYMDKLEWSEYKLSQQSGVPQSTINSMFRNNNNPSLFTLENICNAFNISLSEFFNENNHNVVPQEYQELINKWEQLSIAQKKLILELIDNLK